jgi:hypothetical protein
MSQQQASTSLCTAVKCFALADALWQLQLLAVCTAAQASSWAYTKHMQARLSLCCLLLPSVCCRMLPPCVLLHCLQLRATMQQDLQNMKAVFRQTVFEKAPGARS